MPTATGPLQPVTRQAIETAKPATDNAPAREIQDEGTQRLRQDSMSGLNRPERAADPLERAADPLEGPADRRKSVRPRVGDPEMTRIAPAPRPAMTDERMWLVTVCRRELEHEPDAARSARLYFEIARAQADPRDSLDAYVHALELNPDHLPSIRAARRLHLDRRDIKAATLLFDSEIRIVDQRRAKARLWFARGRALEDIGGNVEGARECYRRAVQLDPSCPTYLSAGAQTDHAAGDWPALARAREGMANAVRSDTRHRATILAERARLLETRIGDVESAAELYEQASHLEVQTSSTGHALKRLLYMQSRWRELVTVLEREAAATSDASVRIHALFAISRIQSERLGDRAAAVQALSRAMQVSTSDRLVLESMSRIYEQAGEYLSLAHTLAHAVEATDDPDERLLLMHRIGELYERQLKDDDNARRWYEAALRINPDHPPVIRALDKLYERARSWQPIIAMYLGAAEATTSNTRRAHAHARIAEIFEDHVKQAEEAMRHHAQALSLDPSLAGSFKSLTRLYAEHKRHAQLIELYERGIERATEEDLRVAFLMKVGLIYEDVLADPVQAMHAYQRILTRQPSHLAALHALQRVAERGGRHAELAEALESETALTRDQRRQTALLQRAGDVLAEKVGDVDAAILTFKRVLTLDAHYAPALASLGRIFHDKGRHEALRDIYERELELAATESSKVALLFKLGELCELKLGDNDRAIAYYRSAIQANSSHGPSLRALAFQLRRRGDFRGLVGVLQSELVGDLAPAIFAPRAYRLGEVFEMHLSDYRRAAAAYTRALEADAAFRPAIEALLRVRTQLQDWQGQATDLLGESRRLQDPALAIDALMRAGEIYSELLADRTRAISAYVAVRDIQKDNLPALHALEPLYRSAGAYAELAEVYSMLSSVLAEPTARIAVLEELARIYETQNVGDAGDIRRTLSAILSINPTHLGSLESLEQLALTTKDTTLLADVDARFAQAVSDPALIAAHQTRLGIVLTGTNPTGALAAFRSALEHDANSITSIRGLGRAAHACGDARAMVDAFRREAAWTQTGELAAEALVQSAQLRREHLRDDSGAIEDAERALERWPDHEPAARMLSDLLREAEQPDRLITLLSRAAGAAVDGIRIASLWRVVTRLYADDKQDLGAALAALDRIPEAHAGTDLTLKLRGDIYVRNKRWNDAIEVYGQALKAKPSRESRFLIHMELGRIHLNRTKDHKAATIHLKKAVKLDDSHREALLSLFDLQKQVEDWDDARLTAQSLLKIVRGPSEQSWAWLQLGRVELKAGRTRQGADALRNAVALEGPFGDAAQDYKKILGEDEGWDRYVGALQEHIQRVTSGELSSSNLRDVYATVANIQHEVLIKTDDAVKTLRAALEATHGDSQIHLELAERLGQVSRRDEAVVEYRKLVIKEPSNVGAWRGMARAFHESGRKLESGVMLAPLVVLGAATEIEAGMSRQKRVLTGQAKPDSFNADALLEISAGESWAESRVSALLGSINEALSKLYPTDFERYGIGARDRLRSEHRVHALCTRIGQAFGIEEFDVYVHTSHVTDVVVELAQPPALMVPQFVTKLPEAEQVFVIARAFVSLAREVHAVVTLGRGEITRVVVAALRTVSPTFGSGRFPDDDLNQLQKRIYKALSRRSRKQLETTATQFLGKPPIDLDRWGQSLELTTARAAALLTNDLPSVVSVLRQTGATPARVEGAALVTSSPMLTDLLRFWATPDALNLRRRAGII